MRLATPLGEHAVMAPRLVAQRAQAAKLLCCHQSEIVPASHPFKNSPIVGARY